MQTDTLHPSNNEVSQEWLQEQLTRARQHTANEQTNNERIRSLYEEISDLSAQVSAERSKKFDIIREIAQRICPYKPGDIVEWASPVEYSKYHKPTKFVVTRVAGGLHPTDGTRVLWYLYAGELTAKGRPSKSKSGFMHFNEKHNFRKVGHMELTDEERKLW